MYAFNTHNINACYVTHFGPTKKGPVHSLVVCFCSDEAIPGNLVDGEIEPKPVDEKTP